MDEEAFKALLMQAGRGETAAVLAAVAGDQQALLHRADQQYGNTLLHWASAGGDLELVQGLVQRGSDLHAKDDEGEDALFYTTYNNNLAVATYLLDRGTDPCTRSVLFNALGWAAYRGYQDMCLLLLSRGADLEAKMRGHGAEGAEERTALELYGEWTNISAEEKEQRRQALRVNVVIAVEVRDQRGFSLHSTRDISSGGVYFDRVDRGGFDHVSELLH
jgi:hypothetical protein